MWFLAWESNNSWTDTNCDQRESAYGWDRSQHNFDFQQLNQISNLRAPCSACTIPNNVGKSIEFELRGLCERFCSDYCFFYVFCRSGFDTDFMVNNDEETGLISYIGKIFPDIVRIRKILPTTNFSGKKYTKIQYDQSLYQWNISVSNNPRISAVSYSDVSTMVIGKSSSKDGQND